MTGKKTNKQRFIISSRLLVPSAVRKDMSEKAMEFKNAVNASIKKPQLDVDVAVKAANMNSKPTYNDTDGKKRDFTGNNVPGLEQVDGYRWAKNKKYEEGDVLQLFPSLESRSSSSTKPNFGWITPEVPEGPVQEKPQIRITKYKTNPKTGEIIRSTGKILDGFAPWTGRTYEENEEISKNARGEQKGSFGDMQTKNLPGRSLRSRVPGGNLLARSASKFGIWVDAGNKFRCPPGTPAANQFTDAMGTNCFGISAERAIKLIADKVGDAVRAMNDAKFDMTPPSFSSGATTTDTDTPSRPAPPSKGRQFLRSVGVLFDAATNFALTGEFVSDFIYEEWDVDRPVINPPDVHTAAGAAKRHNFGDAKVPPALRSFKNAMERGQRADKRITSVIDDAKQILEIDTSSSAVKENDDAYALVEALQKRGWEVEVVHENGAKRLKGVRLQKWADKRAKELWEISHPGQNWDMVKDDEKARLAQMTKQEYLDLERGVLEGMAYKYLQNPEQANKDIKRIKFVPNEYITNDEAGFHFEFGQQTGGAAGEPKIQTDPQGVTYIKLDNMHRQFREVSKLPQIRPDEALVVEAVGGSDAAGKAAVSDYLSDTTNPGKRLAALTGGAQGYARFVAFHESNHAQTAGAALEDAQRQMDARGYIELRNQNGEIEQVVAKSIKDLTSDQAMAILWNFYGEEASPALQATLKDLYDKGLIHAAGGYAMEQLRKTDNSAGRRVVHETLAELAALREYGFVFGPDVDEALSEVDKYNENGFFEERIMRGVEDTPGLSTLGKGDPVTTASENLDGTPEGMARYEELLMEAQEVSAQDKKAIIKKMNKELKNMDEDELIETAAWMELNKYLTSESTDLADPVKSEFFSEALKNIRKEWNERFGVGASSNKRYKQMVDAKRDELGILTSEEIQAKNRDQRRAEYLGILKEMSREELMIRLSSADARKSAANGLGELEEINAEEELLKREIIKRAREAGDTRSFAKIVAEAKEEVEKKNSPRPKKVRKYKSIEETRETGKLERARLRKKLTKEQADAVKQLGDMKEPGVIQLLEPGKQSIVGPSINKKHNRLKKLGIETDPRSVESASFDEQIENILIPSMEAMDLSSVGSAMEVEVLVDVEPGELTGRSIGKKFDVQKLTSGTMINKKEAPKSPRRKKDAVTGKSQRRVIVEVQPGDRGMFPKSEKGETQTFVMPPGSFEVVSRDEDGTLRIRAVRQKDTTEVIDDLIKSVSEGADNKLWRQSASRRIRAIGDKRVVSKMNSSEEGASLSSGGSASSIKDKTPKRIRERNRQIERSIEKLGSTFLMDDPTDPTETIRPSSKIKTNPLDALSGKDIDLSIPIDRNSIEPEVRNLLDNLPKAEIDNRINRSAFKFHTGMDRRVRVRMRESELDKFAESGVFRSAPDSMSSGDRAKTRRRSNPISKRERERIFATFNDTQKPTEEQRIERERVHAESVLEGVELTLEIKSNKAAFTNMTDEELRKKYGGAVRISETVSPRGERVYDAYTASHAKALLANGFLVNVVDDGTAELIEESILKFTDDLNAKLANTPEWEDYKKEEIEKLKKINGGKNPSKTDMKKIKEAFEDRVTINLCSYYVDGKNIFCGKNAAVEREAMPQLSGRLLDSNTMGMRMLLSGLGGPGSKFEFDLDKITKDTPNADKFKKIAKIIAREGYASEKLNDEDKSFFLENVDFSMSEVDIIPQLRQLIASQGKTTTVKDVVPIEMHAAQNQLLTKKVAGMADITIQSVKKITQELVDEGYARNTEAFTDELRKRMLDSKASFMFGATLSAKGNYMLDGHHRWAGLFSANRRLDADQQMLLKIEEVDEDIITALEMGRIVQDHMGIKAAKLTDEIIYKPGEMAFTDADALKEHMDILIDTADEKIEKLKQDKIFRGKEDSLVPTEAFSSGRTNILEDQRRWEAAQRTSGVTDKFSDGLKLNRARTAAARSNASQESLDSIDSAMRFILISEGENRPSSRAIKDVTTDIFNQGGMNSVSIYLDELLNRGIIDKNKYVDIAKDVDARSGREMESMKNDLQKLSKLTASRRKTENGLSDALDSLSVSNRMSLGSSIPGPDQEDWLREPSSFSSGLTGLLTMGAMSGSISRPPSNLSRIIQQDESMDMFRRQSRNYEDSRIRLTDKIQKEKKSNPLSTELKKMEAELAHVENMIESFGSRLSKYQSDDVFQPNQSKKLKRTLKSMDKKIFKSKIKNSTDKITLFQAGLLIATFEENGEFNYHEAYSVVDDISQGGGAKPAQDFIDELFRRKAINKKQKRGLEGTLPNDRDEPADLGQEFVNEREKFTNELLRIFDIPESEARQANLSSFFDRAPQREKRTRGLGILPTYTSSSDQDDMSLSSGGASTDEVRRSYYEKLGLGRDVPDELMPVNGYVVHGSMDEARKSRVKSSGLGNVGDDALFETGDIDPAGDGLTALGEIEIVLKPEVSERTSYGRGGLGNDNKPVRMNSTDRQAIAKAIIGTGGARQEGNDMDTSMNLLKSSISNDFSNINTRRASNGKFAPLKGTDLEERKRDAFEAHILGGFDKDEVEAINYPFSKIKAMSENEDISDIVNPKSIAAQLRKAGFTEEEIRYFYSVGGGEKLNTASMQMLRQFRAAQKVKEKYKKVGFDNVRIAHPDGINIEDPRSYAQGAGRASDVEKVITSRIMRDILESAEKMQKETKKKPIPRMMSSVGSGS